MRFLLCVSVSTSFYLVLRGLWKYSISIRFISMSALTERQQDGALQRVIVGVYVAAGVICFVAVVAIILYTSNRR